jgi:simple sugar transport system ATP-binding protein
MAAPDSPAFAIEAVGLEKSFGPVRANAGIDLALQPGSVHAVIGENGAGKSTLMNMLYGLYRPDAGEIRIGGQARHFNSPRDAHAAGIGMVHQHFMLVDNFTVLENAMLGFEGGAILAPHMAAATIRLQELAAEYGLEVPLDAKISDLPVGLQQRVEILKALFRGAEILILDEPTGVLMPQESEQLFQIIKALCRQGKTILFISHKLPEVMRIANRVSVMRQGRIVAERAVAETSEAELAELIVGGKVARETARSGVASPSEILRLEGVSLARKGARDLLDDISFTLHQGEILGIAGVAGNGQGELLEVITGMRRPTAGRITLAGELVADTDRYANARELRALGLGHVAEDRLRSGAVAAMTAQDNAILGYHGSPRYAARGMLDMTTIRADCAALVEDNDVRPPSPGMAFGKFSGGNQQKIVIGRELLHDPLLLVVGQPTRGVDIGAVTRIHDQLTTMRNEGRAVLVVSSDLDELMAIADRILVMCEGRVVGEVAAEAADERSLGLMMAGRRLEDANDQAVGGGGPP